jgi:hypothetical protein
MTVAMPMSARSVIGGETVRVGGRPGSGRPALLPGAMSVGVVQGSVATATRGAMSAIAVLAARPSGGLAGVVPTLTGSSATDGTERHGAPAASAETA